MFFNRVEEQLMESKGAGGEHPARWKSLGPAAPGSRIDFVRYGIPPSTVLGPATAHAPGTVEHIHVATGPGAAGTWRLGPRMPERWERDAEAIVAETFVEKE
jgi:hypothetical protein